MIVGSGLAGAGLGASLGSTVMAPDDEDGDPQRVRGGAMGALVGGAAGAGLPLAGNLLSQSALGPSFGLANKGQIPEVAGTIGGAGLGVALGALLRKHLGPGTALAGGLLGGTGGLALDAFRKFHGT